ncbi:bifunctional DNA primase/polymerase [Streptomyces sp. H27-D2]|uniref:bifunctional DNA primase/polymerase n=1 Tax=Streptomyces sp. H27-D2 TaxID=3046304 RepID=UPI002DBE4AF3|nr:bifunctional DNA primase/polymerase [Streptomyces sp. H27-D2]MEC4018862.1 bifunctional DNA primase/polymerase [Streptomyces sp. H27-D2]
MTHQPQSALLCAALDAAERGWAVFPLRSADKRPALHGEAYCPGLGDCAGGHRKWEQRATTDPDRIRRAWADIPFNVGVATGPSGLVVIDLDMPKSKTRTKSSADTPSGVTTFQALCERAGQAVPTTYRVRTASGGEHLYFTAPTGVRLANSAGKLGKLIDTRAWGGYVVAAGSATPAGPYTVNDPAPVAPLPDWLCALLTVRQASRALTALPSLSKGSAYATAALRAEIAEVASAPEGKRNWTLLRAARALGRFVASGDLDRDEVQDSLNGAGQAAGLRERECTPVIASALNWSITHNPGKAS